MADALIISPERHPAGVFGGSLAEMSAADLGGVCIGEPLGCIGSRMVVTLLNALERTGARRGITTLCIGGGEGVAMAVERLH